MIPHARVQISPSENQAVMSVIDSGRWADGAETGKLEECLSGLYDGSHVVVVSSGTAALCLALHALGVSSGSDVVMPSYTCNSLYAAAAHTGARAVCADVGPGTVTVTPETVGDVMSAAVRAVIVPHTFGYLADVPGIAALGSAVIEDCAQAVGGRYPDGTRVGTRGDIAVFSFHATKMLPSGAGGACITRDAGLAATIRQLRYCDERPLDARAFNFRLNDICASIVRAKIPALDSYVRERARIADLYDGCMSQWAFARRHSAQQAVCYRYLVQVERDADAFMAEAAGIGIACRKPVWKPLHHTLGGLCPRTDKLWRTIVSVPIYPGMEEKEIAYVCKELPALLSLATAAS